VELVRGREAPPQVSHLLSVAECTNGVSNNIKLHLGWLLDKVVGRLSMDCFLCNSLNVHSAFKQSNPKKPLG